MVVKVDPNKCIGCGACVAICSAVFNMGSDGKAKVKNPKGQCDVESAKSGCPVGAISV